MTKTILLALALAAGCSKDERKPLDTGACDAYAATLTKVDACTKLDAAAKTKVEQARNSAQMMIDLDERGSTTDTKHVRANTCRTSQQTIAAVLTAAGC